VSEFELPHVPRGFENAGDLHLAAVLAQELAQAIKDQNDRAELLLSEADAFVGFDEFREEVETDLATEQKQTLLKLRELRDNLQEYRVEEYRAVLEQAIAEIDERINTERQEHIEKIDAAVQVSVKAVPANAEKYMQMGESLKARGTENVAELQNFKDELNGRLGEADIIRGALQTIQEAPSPALWAQFPTVSEEVHELEQEPVIDVGPLAEAETKQPAETVSDETEVLAEPSPQETETEVKVQTPDADDSEVSPEKSSEFVQPIPVDEAQVAQKGVKKELSEKAQRAEEVHKRYLEDFVNNTRRIRNADDLVDSVLFDDSRFPEKRSELKNLVHIKLNPSQGGGKAIRRDLAKANVLLQRGRREVWLEEEQIYARPERIYRSIIVGDYRPDEDDGEGKEGNNKVIWEPINITAEIQAILKTQGVDTEDSGAPVEVEEADGPKA
jgi:hypothetical protein